MPGQFTKRHEQCGWAGPGSGAAHFAWGGVLRVPKEGMCATPLGIDVTGHLSPVPVKRRPRTSDSEDSAWAGRQDRLCCSAA